MKNKRGLFIMTGAVLLCLLLGVYFCLKKQNEVETATTETQEEEAETIVSVPEEDIKNITFQMDGQSVTWTKEETGWTMSQDENFPVDSDAMTQLVSELASISVNRTLEDVNNRDDYGLEDPINVIKIEKTDDSTEVITVGTKNPSTGDTYICVGDDKNTVYTVSNDLGDTFSCSIYDLAVSEAYPTITGTTIKKIQVDKKDNSYTVESDEDSSTGWYVEDNSGDKKKADATNTGTLQSTIAGLTYKGYYNYDCKDWSEYGLDKPKMTIRVDYTEQVTTDVTDDEADNADSQDENSTDADSVTENVTDMESETEAVEKTLTLYVGSLGEDGNYYVRLGNSQEVHGMAQSAIDSLLNGKDFDYWKLSVESIAIDELKQLDVTYENKIYSLKRDVKEEESEDDSEETKTVTTYYVNDEEADSDAFMKFYRNAQNMVCQRRLEDYSTNNEPEIQLEYYGNDGSVVTVSYISRDSNFYTMVDSEGNYGLVNKMNVKDLIDSLIKLVNK